MMRSSNVRTGSTHAAARRCVLGVILGISQVGCSMGSEPGDVALAGEAPTPALAEIDRAVVTASSEFGIPVEVLRQVLHARGPRGLQDGDAGLGPLGLTAKQLELGAEIVGVPEDAAVAELEANLRVGAAVLANIADDLELDREDEAAWTPALVAFHEGATGSDALVPGTIRARAAALEGTLWMTTPRPGACEADGLEYLGSSALTPSRHLQAADESDGPEDGVAYELVSGYSEVHRYRACTFGERYDVYTRAGARYNCRRVERRAGAVISETYVTDWQEDRDAVLCGVTDTAAAGPG